MVPTHELANSPDRQTEENSQEQASPVKLTDQEFLSQAEAVVALEWKQFQKVTNEGGRALCQGNWPVFHQMRLSQFLTWTAPLLISYLQDLEEAEQEGRNLLTEKYARMMESTDGDYYRQHLEAFMPALSEKRHSQQERIISRQVVWAKDFVSRYPHLGSHMRVITTSEDTINKTSLETYLRGELGTYSQRTLDLYDSFIASQEQKGLNETEQTIGWTVRMAGFTNLTAAEKSQEESIQKESIQEE